MIIMWNRYVRKALLIYITRNIIKFKFDLNSYHFQYIFVQSHSFSSVRKENLGFKTIYSFYSHERQIYSILNESLLHSPVALKAIHRYRSEE